MQSSIQPGLDRWI